MTVLVYDLFACDPTFSPTHYSPNIFLLFKLEVLDASYLLVDSDNLTIRILIFFLAESKLISPKLIRPF